MLDRTTAYGLDFMFPAGDTTVGASLKAHGEFARPELDLLLDYAEGAAGTFVDVGANIGAIALPFAKARPGWTVAAIEAHRGLCNVMAANALNNSLYNVEAIHAAAGAETKLVDFPAPKLSREANYGTLSLLRVGGSVEPTRMFRLDDLAPKSTALVKIDVEGYEPEVLKGAVGLLAARRAVWLAEASDQKPEASQGAIAAFLAAGYRVFWLFAPFSTPASERGAPETPLAGDVNVVALPPQVENRWGLPEVSSPDATRPTSVAAFAYMARYGYAIR